ncbi:SH3 domain-containing protein [Saccharothrix australiensis]|uniref:SH3 domain-containing protein n=1 Tax=Saccharothrix australiensis TaxID=2072 RepID=UPI0011C39B16|nr:SH3 domain-containing protein [Saccharothrix australiensis]
MAGVLATAGVMYVANGGKPMGGASGASAECEVTVTADILNVRTGPADTEPIVSTLRLDAVVKAERTVQNGFRQLSDGHWVKDDFVTPTSDGDCG